MFSEIKALVMFAAILAFSGVLFAQNEYPHGNAAYISEANLNYSDVRIGGGDFVYSYNHETNQYQYANYILIPDLSEMPNGNYVSVHAFYGYGSMGSPTDTAFQWDGLQIFDQSPFDKSNLFVSPISANAMNYAEVLDPSQSVCVTDDCYFTIYPPASSLAWPNYNPGLGTYEMWAGEELVNAGDLKSTGTDSKHSQQQIGMSENPSYCVSQYGQGWRLPTDIEVGHFNDEEGTGNGFQSGYRGSSATKYIWTSSLFKTFNVKRWPVRVTDGYWENCAGFLYTSNFARCVFDPSSLIVTEISKENTPTKVEIYPNPANHFVKIQFVDRQDVNLRILNVNQIPVKTVHKRDVQSVSIDLSDLAAGIYYIEIETKQNSIICEKLIITP